MLNRIKFCTVVLGSTALGACGGGSGGSAVDLSPDTNDIIVTSVEATGPGDSLDAAETFQIYYSLVFQPDGTPIIQVGRGQIDVINADTIAFTRQEGDTPTEFTAITPGSDTYEGDLGGSTATITLSKGTGGTLAYLQGDTADNGFGLAGIYGFETPIADLPSGAVVYNNAGLATAYIAEEGSPDNIQVFQPGSTNPALTVNFGTGSVTGTLFDGTADIDLADDGTANDILNLVVTIENGSISSGDITGNVSLAADVDVFGDGNIDLAPTVSSSAVDASIFGSTGNVVAGTFEADSQYNLDGESIGAAVGGTFFTVGSP